MANSVLDLSSIVNVSVNVSPTAVSNETFNEGLIVGNSAIIPNATRLTSYQTTAQMIAAGFTALSPEYIAANLYFSQSPAPTVLWVGRQDTTALNAVAINTAGTNYVVGDLITITQSGASGGILIVTTVTTGGVVSGVTIQGLGTGYTTGTALATTTNSVAGAGFKANISAIGETALQAVTACRAASNAWYQVIALQAAKADHIAIAPYIESASPKSMYMYSTADSDVLSGAGGNVFLTLQAALYKRSWGLYSSTLYAAAAALGVACGLNTGLANSAFVMMFKQLVGVTPEVLTYAQVSQISGVPGSNFGQGGNCYITYNSEFSILQQGNMANGYFLDQVLFRDMLSNAIQTQLMNLLVDNPKVPLTDAGVTQELHVINQQCSNFVAIGYLARGTWNGVQILNLNTGDTMPLGYSAQAPLVSTLTTAQRSHRTSPPIYVAVNEASGVQNVVIGVYPQA